MADLRCPERPRQTHRCACEREFKDLRAFRQHANFCEEFAKGGGKGQASDAGAQGEEVKEAGKG
jgi:hypothetical protein